MSIQLNMEKWGQFRVGDYFSPSKSNAIVHDVSILVPQISATSYKNGINDMVETNVYWEGNAITVSCNGTTGGCDAFYQKGPFTITSDTVVWNNENLNELNSIFICKIISLEKLKYSYGRKCNIDRQEDLVISLPQDENGDPDWQFMEDYIKSLRQQTEGKIKDILDTTNGNTKIVSILTEKNIDFDDFKEWANVKVAYNDLQCLDTMNWKPFVIKRTFETPGLFDIEACKCGNAGALIDGDDIYYRGAKKSNNGVMKSVQLEGDSIVSKGNGIMFICDGDGSCGYVNYIEDDFIGSTTTSVGYDNALTKENAMFLVTILDKEKYKYSHGRKYRVYLDCAHIYLPVQCDENGVPFLDKTNKYSKDGYVPDWQFMEDYIKSLPYSARLNDIQNIQLNISENDDDRTETTSSNEQKVHFAAGTGAINTNTVNLKSKSETYQDEKDLRNK